MAAATALAAEGHQVTILEKNASPGGRARRFADEGFTFDMGPSWYWMPQVFEDYFARFGKQVKDFYKLHRLDPSYRVYFGLDDYVDIPAQKPALLDLFESMEKGSAKKLEKFLEEAAYKYKVGMDEFVWKPSHSIVEYIDLRILLSGIKLQMFSSISKQIRSMFTNEKLIKILEFPVLFLGAKPQKTPALYSLMNYADLELGTWYPEGGMFQIVEAMVATAEAQGVKFVYKSTVTGINKEGKTVRSVQVGDQHFDADFVVSSADYEFTDRVILKESANYKQDYWNKRDMAPSSLLFYLGVKKKLPDLEHHNLFFDEDFEQHADDIYEQPRFPEKPLMYVSVVSKTDPKSAPQGCENLFVLIPLAPGLEDTEEQRSYYFDFILKKLEQYLRTDIKNYIIYKRSYAHKEFVSDYNAFKGNAYGLANTLRQTAILKPKLKNKKLNNFYYTGQLTTPGPGVPPSLISGQVVAKEILKKLK
jgi:phytoene desaturase